MALSPSDGFGVHLMVCHERHHKCTQMYPLSSLDEPGGHSEDNFWLLALELRASNTQQSGTRNAQGGDARHSHRQFPCQR
jgi:hypothetical protein